MALNFLTGLDVQGNVNINQKELRNAVVQNLGTAPGTPLAGQIYYDTGDNKIKLYNGSSWLTVPDGTGANNYLTGLSFNTSNGILTATRQGLSDITVDLDGRYALSSAIPTVGNGELTVSGTGVLSGTTTFTANQSGDSSVDITHDNVTRSNTTSTVSNNTFTVIDTITSSAQGHITAVNTKTVTVSDDDTTSLPIKNAGGTTQFTSTDATGLRFEGGTNVTVDFTSSDQTVKINSTDQYQGTVTGIGTATSGTIAIAGTSAVPTVSTITAAVTNGGTALATGDQIYDFVTGQIANIPSGLSFEGSWNANTDTPSLSGTTPDNGTFYIVSVAGSTNLSGITDWEVGDWAVYVSDGAGTDGWQKIDNTSTLSGSGTAGQLTYWTGTANVAGDAGLTYNATSNNLEVGNNITAGGTITSSGGNSGEWNTAYDNMITAVGVSGTSTKTITLTQQDGGTLTANWTDIGESGTVTGVTGTSPIQVTSSSTTPDVSILTATGSQIGAGNVAPGEGIDVSYSGGTATVSGENSTPTNKGIVIVAGGTGINVTYSNGTATIASTAQSANTYAATITDSVSGTTFNHGLGDDVIVQLYDATTKETVYADVERNGNYLNITFASTPTNSIRVLVQKIG
jgi:hypothetical protein